MGKSISHKMRGSQTDMLATRDWKGIFNKDLIS